MDPTRPSGRWGQVRARRPWRALRPVRLRRTGRSAPDVWWDGGAGRRRRRARAWGAVAAVLAVGLVAGIVFFGARPSGPQLPTGPSVLDLRATKIMGWLHTDGQRIVDESGQGIRLLGINVTGMQAGTGTALSALPEGTLGCTAWQTPAVSVYDDIQAWGFNVVRLPISWANLEPTAPVGGVHTYNAAYLQALDGVVARYRNRHVAVILSMQQNVWSPAFPRITDGTPGKCPGSGMPVWLYQGTSITTPTDAKIAFFADQDGVQEQLAEAWTEVAARYADEPTVVGFDMLNEPYGSGDRLPPSALNLDRLYQTLGSAIRSVNGKAMLCFEDSQDKGDGVFSLTGPPHFKNVVYSFHLYQPGWDPDGLAVTQDYEKRADEWGVPLWMGEFNLFRATSNSTPSPSPDWPDQSAQMLAYDREHDISWTVFAFSGGSSIVVKNTSTPRPGVLVTLQRGF